MPPSTSEGGGGGGPENNATSHTQSAILCVVNSKLVVIQGPVEMVPPQSEICFCLEEALGPICRCFKSHPTFIVHALASWALASQSLSLP
jgi:hypothetical protein